MTSRHVPFSTVFNFRDLGGYPTADGRSVKPGRLYRADGLFRLAEQDFEKFSSLGLRTVLDLRRPDEVATDGRIAGSLGLAYHHVDLDPTPWPPVAGVADRAAMARYYADRYAIMVDAGLAAGNPVGRALRLLVEPDHTPLVFHCLAGKDRTGVIAALTLAAVGVSDDDIAADYALSAEAERQYFEWLSARDALPDGAIPFWARHPSPPEAMRTFLIELRQRHGSIEGYLARAGIGPDEIGSLRDHLLD